MKDKLYLVFISFVVLIALFIFGSEKFHQSEIKRLDFLAHEKAGVFVRPYSLMKGEKDAKIFVTEFLDPECEGCRKMYPFVSKLLEEYKGKIKIVIRYAPLHPNSVFAVKVLEASRKQGKYWETLEVLFENLSEWGSHENPRPEMIWTYLPSLGLDVERLKVDMESEEIARIIEQDKKDGIELGVRRTPTFFVNGKPLSSFGPQYLKEAIEKDIKLHKL